MEINKYSVIVIAACCNFSSSHAKFKEMYDFYYETHIDLQENTNVIKMLSNFISKSEISTVIENLRLVKEQNKKVHHIQALKDRILEAEKALNRKTHSLGFFNAKTTHQIKQISDKKLKVSIDVKLGTPFKLKTKINFQKKGDFSEIEQSAHERAKHLTASINNMTEIAQSVLDDLQKIGYYKPKFAEQRVNVDFEKKTATLILNVNPGARVVFGESTIKSFKGIDDNFIRNRISWNEGELFNIQKVKATAEALRSTQIFSTIEVRASKNGYIEKEIPNEQTVDGCIPMDIILEEDKKHMIEASVLYSGIRNMNFERTSRVKKDLKSVITRVSWTRFNAFNHGEQFKITVEGTPMKATSKRADYAFEIALSQPDAFFINNTANYEISRKQELTNAFFRKIDQYSAIYSYPIFKNVLIKYGGYLTNTYVDEEEALSIDNVDKRYRAITFPFECIIDHTDDVLNPTKGYRFKIKVAESFFSGAHIKHLPFGESNFSYNLPLDSARKNVISASVTYKVLFKQKLQNIPIDQRIYCGGIGSVRGYANQMATEMYVNADCPAGGKSAFEFNIEARRRFSKDFGGVLFLDGAKTYQNQTDKLFTEKKRWFLSFGAGVRYFTSIGPIRFDFAFPIHRRKGVDSRMQFIMSLGQTF